MNTDITSITVLRKLTESAQVNVINAMVLRRPASEIRMLKTIRDNLERAYVAAQLLPPSV